MCFIATNIWSWFVGLYTYIDVFVSGAYGLELYFLIRPYRAVELYKLYNRHKSVQKAKLICI